MDAELCRGFQRTTSLSRGKTNALVNRALVTSQDIDSNGSSMGAQLLSVAEWQLPDVYLRQCQFHGCHDEPPGNQINVDQLGALYNSTNFLRYKTNLTSTNWVTLTNFVQGPANSRVTVTDPVQTNGGRFYKVEIDPQQP